MKAFSHIQAPPAARALVASQPDFAIHLPAEGPLGRTGDRVVDTHVEAGRASGTQTTTTAWTNPLYILSQGLVGPAAFGEARRTSRLPDDAATGAAVRALHRLGAEHGVTAVLLGIESGYPSFMFRATPGLFLSGGDTSKQLGPAAQALEQAARAVLAHAG